MEGVRIFLLQHNQALLNDSVIFITHLTVHVTVTSSCASLTIEQTNTSGIILSTAVTRSTYSDDMDCQWNLVSGVKMEITFYVFSTEPDADHLYVYDGDSSSSSLIGNFNGTSLPAPITSSSNKLHLRFTSDSSVSARGFTAGYRGKMLQILHLSCQVQRLPGY